jgi:hypothetical protein
MALDFTNFATFHANSRSANCASVGASFVTTFSSPRVTTAVIGGLHQQAGADALGIDETCRCRKRAGMRSTRTLAFFFA